MYLQPPLQPRQVPELAAVDAGWTIICTCFFETVPESFSYDLASDVAAVTVGVVI